MSEASIATFPCASCGKQDIHDQAYLCRVCEARLIVHYNDGPDRGVGTLEEVLRDHHRAFNVAFGQQLDPDVRDVIGEAPDWRAHVDRGWAIGAILSKIGQPVAYWDDDPAPPPGPAPVRAFSYPAATTTPPGL